MARSLLIFIAAALLLGGAAFAALPQPAEEPPADFTARQYIDSKGCVFLRQGSGVWQARVARDGAPICGYPPTFSARRLSPDMLAATAPSPGPEPSRAALIEEALTRTVVTNLRPGELVGQAEPLQLLPDLGPEPVSDAPARLIAAEIKAAPALRAQMGSGLKPNQNLCHLLGYNGGKGQAPGEGAGLGKDPSQGFCDGLAGNDLARLAFNRPVPVASPAPAAEAEVAVATAASQTLGARESGAQVATDPSSQQMRPKARPKPLRVAAQRRDQRAADKVKAVQPRPAATKQAARTDEPIRPLLAAGARYVQVGVYSNGGNADRAAAHLGKLGMPVLRSYVEGNGPQLHVIVAGPFDNHRTLVIALDRIRRAGFPDAYPR
ncbi:SPOR domain-containing protein [Paracoccus aminophilus]|nr:SPOR domain-containing protein [Paracoccus aminophilus]